MNKTNEAKAKADYSPPSGVRVKYLSAVMLLILVAGPLFAPWGRGPFNPVWLAAFCAIGLAAAFGPCRDMWTMKTKKTPRWITVLAVIAIVVPTSALIVMNERGIFRWDQLYLNLPLTLSIAAIALCAWICEAHHGVRIYAGLTGYSFVPKSVPLNPWAWLRCGGWIRVLPEDPAAGAKRSTLRRTRIYLSRIGADIAKVLLILLAIYFMSMPFWPLAVPPVPAELKAKYPVPEFQPRGSGDVEKLWFSLYPQPSYWTNEPPELLAAPLYRFCKARQMGLDPDWTSPVAVEYRAWLAEVEPQIHVLADWCMEEDPPDTPVEGFVSSVGNYRPLTDLFKVLPGIHAIDGDGNASLKTIQSFSRISAYHTRSDVLTGWLVGNLLAEMMTRSVVALYARDLIDPPVAEELEKIFKEWQAERGIAVRSIVKEGKNSKRMVDVVWKKASLNGPLAEWGSPRDQARFERQAWLIRRWGWVFGNDYRSAHKAGKNLHDRMEIEAVIWSDPAIALPSEVARGLLDFPELRFRRGVLAATLTPQMSDFYRKYFWSDATHRIGHALAAIGAYKKTHNALPASLDAAFAAAGIGSDFQTRYVDQVPIYQRLDNGAPAETNTYAFALTIWGDGGRCDKGGGVSWLIVRNPAFGEGPLQCWKWSVLMARNGIVESQEVKLLGTANELDPALIPADKAKPDYLGVPATLLGADTGKIEEAKNALRRFGWQEVPIPPNVNAGM